MQRPSVDEIIKQRRDTGILFDSNLLILLAIGAHDVRLIERCKQTTMFTENDYSFLADLANTFSKRITTPNILTEVDNLTNRLGYRFSQSFKALIGLLDEIYYKSSDVCIHEQFPILGLTDCTIVHAADSGVLVVTMDLDLALYIESKGLAVINYNHYLDKLYA